MIGALKPTLRRLSTIESGAIPRIDSRSTALALPSRTRWRVGIVSANSSSSRSRNGDRFSIEKDMALWSSSCRITGTDSWNSSLSMRLRSSPSA